EHFDRRNFSGFVFTFDLDEIVNELELPRSRRSAVVGFVLRDDTITSVLIGCEREVTSHGVAESVRAAEFVSNACSRFAEVVDHDHCYLVALSESSKLF